MISSLRGVVAHVGLNSAVIDVNGFGMLVQATPQTLGTLFIGREAQLATTMIVREDSMTLYGFEDAAQREVFETLISVSGVGPRLGLAALSVHSPEALRIAAADGDNKAFSKVPGIGPKLAGRIVLELAGKLVPTGERGSAAGGWLERPGSAGALRLGMVGQGRRGSRGHHHEENPEAAAAGHVGDLLRLTLRRAGPGRCPDRFGPAPRRSEVACPRRRGEPAGLHRIEAEERAIEAALRPKNLDDFVGQHRVRKQLSLVLEASRMRGRSADHVLLSGPARAWARPRWP